MSMCVNISTKYNLRLRRKKNYKKTLETRQTWILEVLEENLPWNQLLFAIACHCMYGVVLEQRIEKWSGSTSIFAFIYPSSHALYDHYHMQFHDDVELDKYYYRIIEGDVKLIMVWAHFCILLWTFFSNCFRLVWCCFYCC